jgi:hypothetical protein
MSRVGCGLQGPSAHHEQTLVVTPLLDQFTVDGGGGVLAVCCSGA